MNIATTEKPKAQEKLSLRNPADQKILLEQIAAGTLARENGEQPTGDAIALLRAANIARARLPIDQGGEGMSLTQLFNFVIELGGADSNVAQILRNHFAFGEKALRMQNDPKYAMGMRLLREDNLIGLGATELGKVAAGQMKGATRLDKVGDKYVLNGRKFYSTGNAYCDYLQIYCATPEGQQMTAMIPANRDGVTILDDWDGFGQSRTASGTTVLENVDVLPEEVEDPAGDMKVPFTATLPQLWLTCIVVGMTKGIVKDAIALLKGRSRTFYHALAESPADDPFMHEAIGRLSSIAYVAEASVKPAIEALDAAFESAIAGKLDEEQFTNAAVFSAQAKLVVDKLALEAATNMFEVGSASATMRPKHLDRHWRNIRTLTAHNPHSYKAMYLGNHLVNGAKIPDGGFF